jgi:nucleoside-diphosphate-sugar epimerase
MAGFSLKQRILIVGVENFVASRVENALAQSEWAAPVPCRPSAAGLEPRHLEGIDAIFNGTMGSPSQILGAAGGLYGVLARTGRNPRVVHLSSMTVYGSQTGAVLETTALRTDAGPYGAAQVEAESLARRHPRSVILRPGCEYGPGCPQWSGRIARLLRAHRLGDLGVDGDGVCNLLFVDDLVSAILESLRRPDLDGESFNLAMGSPPTWNEYLARFAKTLGAVPISRIGGRRLKLETRVLAPPLKILELVTRRIPRVASAVPPAITPSLMNLCSQRLVLDSRKAEHRLHLGWTPLQDGLRAAAAFYGADSIGKISMRRNSMG